MSATDILDSLQRALASSYAVERELGRGGMATVYLARDLKHDRRVAVKVLHPDLAAALGAERFLTEIRTTANLQHPHILPLHDSGEADGLLYYVMPYVEGETLRAKLERGPLPIDEAVRLAREVLSALDYAHRHGVVHRDIKPENILLHDGAALVADFGIALAVQSAGGPRMTQTGLSLGTPSYMSPEQAMGEKHIDGRADVYAAGAMLYEMLTGDPPFSGSSVQAIVARVLTEKPTSPRVLRDSVPAPVEAAVLRALSKLPADRFATAAEFATALTAPQMHGVSPANGGVRGRNETLSLGSRPATYAGWVVAGLLAVGLSGTLLVRRPPVSHSVLIQRQLTFSGDVEGVALSPDGLWLAYVRNGCMTRDVMPCTSTIEVREVDGSQSVRIGTWANVEPDLRWTSDGRILFRAGAAGSPVEIRISDRLGGTSRRIPLNASAMAVVGDGRTLVAATGLAGRQWLTRYNLTTLAPLDSVPLPPGVELRDLSASPDGTLAAAADLGGAASVIMLLDASGRMLDTITVPSRQVVRWDSTATAVLVFDDAEAGGIGDDLLRVAVSDHRFVRRAPTVLVGQLATNWAGRFDVARSGRFVLAVGSERNSLLTAPLPAAAQWRTFYESTGFLGGYRFDVTPDGRGVIIAASDNLGENLYVVPFDGSAPRALTAYRAGASDGARWAQDPRYSPNGAWMVFLRAIEGGQLVVAIADSSGGREHDLTATPLTSLWQANWFGDDLIAVYRKNAIVLVDPSGVARDSVSVPDSLALPSGSLLSRTSDRTVFFWSQRANALVAADFVQHATRLFARPPVESLDPLAWDASGALLAVARGAFAKHSNQHPIVVRVGADGSMAPVVALPEGCRRAAVNRLGTAIVCVRYETRRDVWLGVAR